VPSRARVGDRRNLFVRFEGVGGDVFEENGIIP